MFPSVFVLITVQFFHLLSTLLQNLRQVSPRFFRRSVYTSTTSPSSQPSVLPVFCLHFYNISVKSSPGSFTSLSTLLQHLRQVSPRFFRVSVYTIYYISVKSALTNLSSTRNFSDSGLEPTAYFITTCQSEAVQFWTWAGTFVCNNVLIAWIKSLVSSKIPRYLYGHYEINRTINFEH